MKKLLALLLAVLLFCPAGAFAAKARYIVTDEESARHAEHLSLHAYADDCRATGNYIRVRSAGNLSEVIGHLEQADRFTLLGLHAGYALIQITSAHPTSPDSWDGLTGCVDPDYIDCTCTDEAYYGWDSAPLDDDLSSYVGTTAIVCTGNNLRVRSKPVDGEIIGHIEKADEILLQQLWGGWAQIRVVRAASTSYDSWNGLSGWVSAAYLRGNPNALRDPNDLPDPDDGWQQPDPLDPIPILTVTPDPMQYDQLIRDPSSTPEPYTQILPLTTSPVWQQPITITPVPVTQDDSWDGYGSVLEYYYKAIVEQWDDERISEEGFIEPYDFPRSLDGYGFVLRDLNRDGTRELLILSRDYLTDSSAYLFAVYAMQDGSPAPAAWSWSRSRLYLCSDGSLLQQGSMGAAYAINYILDLADGVPVIREGVISGEYAFNNQTRIGWALVDDNGEYSRTDYPKLSEDEAYRLIGEYESRIVRRLYDFTSFAQYAQSR
ncbi:MAG: hypothetical protein J6K32_03790 [Clostridia bacterium]|nr:hypothetical protein [Clostridia bacterium]